MTRERWEVRGWGKALAFSTRAEALGWLRVGVPNVRVVHVRTFAVVSVYAWRAYWHDGIRQVSQRGQHIFTDPTGGHSRKRARAAALAARPSADAVLVRIRRRVP